MCSSCRKVLHYV
ncbi:hypothetical protein KTH73_09280 [Acinetobacter courvalinii]|uniref:Uncharacterized protein n=1 Tax=Acinetobacter halotolerans TaxID=1752076 RepID=A0A4Q6XGB0_9GAMM|nr:hypothetical protein F7P77_17020 [Acinetobacter courvalinii]MBH2001158.1 hypothetical protein [Moraxellaceae bacterium]MBJ8483831.1 hypothetical protein [Acinetobacter vivianii]MBP9787752.1 hypothetical protein [Acinetobacter sp.]RLZ11345.1 hypothetical protein EAH57_01895 [Acinetobacter sp. 2JN-4]RSN81311.1 hypothetical protein EA770_12095 [Acinetobacter baumannii]RZF52230.1 hypothetical protein EXE30_10040 [Acinetobacter halotolerans]